MIIENSRYVEQSPTFSSSELKSLRSGIAELDSFNQTFPSKNMKSNLPYSIVLQDTLVELADEEQAKRLESLVQRQQRRIVQQGSYDDPNARNVQFDRYRNLSKAYEKLSV